MKRAGQRFSQPLRTSWSSFKKLALLERITSHRLRGCFCFQPGTFRQWMIHMGFCGVCKANLHSTSTSTNQHTQLMKNVKEFDHWHVVIFDWHVHAQDLPPPSPPRSMPYVPAFYLISLLCCCGVFKANLHSTSTSTNQHTQLMKNVKEFDHWIITIIIINNFRTRISLSPSFTENNDSNIWITGN